MKNFTHRISRFLLTAFIGSLSIGAVSCGPTRGYVEQDFGNGLAGGVYYNGGPGRPVPPPRPPKHHKPKPPKKHKPKPPKKHKHHKDKHHDHHKDHGHGKGHRSH